MSYQMNLFQKLVKKVKDCIVQDAPPHVEQTLEEFLKDCKLPEKPVEKKEQCIGDEPV